ncbi:DUF2189 domain-containing protein [Curvibacter sp. APW13]|uniref:DUF2189 domain-containing protein n=1 Tax=Curvibacter sp. APW13 TaxID=3077236 RepID=UPI0028DDC3CF|nr:DUF2189 domain-containing protein [Curvibacter sp. APW13]MDT8991511.1 DUF2189 domain-containing protein [Curvibacter sp. APW13]
MQADQTPATDNNATPASPRAPGVLDFRILSPTLASPGQWLMRGWQDFRAAPGIGLFFGACFCAMGWALLAIYQFAPAYTLALSAGFLLTGPFLALGLYQVSQSLERGETPTWWGAVTAWNSHRGQLALFGGVLLILEMLWGRSSMVVFAVSFDGMPDFSGSLLKLLDPQNLSFIVVYTCVGAIFAALVFAVSVVSIPMMLDQEVDAITAGLTSIRLVLSQLPVMVLWGAVITALVVLAMIPGFAGLLVVGPVIGHASWHAYRACVVYQPYTAPKPQWSPPAE